MPLSSLRDKLRSLDVSNDEDEDEESLVIGIDFGTT